MYTWTYRNPQTGRVSPVYRNTAGQPLNARPSDGQVAALTRGQSTRGYQGGNAMGHFAGASSFDSGGDGGE
jgi:hypothetical protein